EQEELEHRIKRESEYREEGRKLRESVLNIALLRENEAALKYMEQAILQQRHRVKKAESQVETARARLQEAMIERKTYEKLKEKAFEEFKKEVAKEENKETDELVSYVYGRRTIQENRS
ncbi:MAG: flagellar export protein FliJ, partial [Lachnospiraceae bacterium]